MYVNGSEPSGLFVYRIDRTFLRNLILMEGTNAAKAHRHKTTFHQYAVTMPPLIVCRLELASYTTSAMLFLHFQPESILSNSTKSAGSPSLI